MKNVVPEERGKRFAFPPQSASSSLVSGKARNIAKGKILEKAHQKATLRSGVLFWRWSIKAMKSIVYEVRLVRRRGADNRYGYSKAL